MKILFLAFFLSYSALAAQIQELNLPEYKTNKQVDLKKEYKGKKIVINFWASWCTACIKELPELEELKSKNSDVVFLAVNAGESLKKIKKFFRKYSFSYRILLDKNKVFSKSIGVLELPQTWVIDSNLKVVYKSDIPPKKL